MADEQLKLNVVKAAKEIIKDKSAWIAHSFAQDAKGHAVHPSDPKAVCFCAEGALKRGGYNLDLYSFQTSFVIEYVDAVSTEMYGKWLVAVNDGKGFDFVHNVFDEVIKRLEAKTTIINQEVSA